MVVLNVSVAEFIQDIDIGINIASTFQCLCRWFLSLVLCLVGCRLSYDNDFGFCFKLLNILNFLCCRNVCCIVVNGFFNVQVFFFLCYICQICFRVFGVIFCFYNDFVLVSFDVFYQCKWEAFSCWVVCVNKFSTLISNCGFQCKFQTLWNWLFNYKLT